VEEIGKRRLAAVAAVFAGILYFFACASPLRKELVLEPVWARSLEPAAGGAPAAKPAKAQGARPAAEAGGAGTESSAKPHYFSLAGRFGYFDAEGELLYSAAVPYGVALAPDAFATYERLSAGFAIRSPSGEELARASLPGYPFFDAGRRFVLAPDQCSVTEIGPDGRALWSRQFGSVITAYGGSPDLAAFGLMDGSIVGLGLRGEELLSFAPGGSRLPGIYGVAVSPDGLLVAAVCGLDKQRLVVLEKRSSAYRVTFHRWLDSDFRRPLAMSFTADGRNLVYEAPGGAGIYERGTRRESLIAAGSVGRVGEAVEGLGMLALLAGSGEERLLVCASPDDRRLIDLRLRASDASLEVDGNSFFLGLDGNLIRMDLREE